MKIVFEVDFDGLADNAAHEQRLAPLPKRWPRYSPGMRACWFAVGSVLAEAGFNPERIGCVACGTNGSHAENRAYFADYLEGGRKLGRGALFIQTLPTAVAAECALHFGLGGPLLYAIAEDGQMDDALALAEACLAQDGVEMMLVLRHNMRNASCMAMIASKTNKKELPHGEG